ncbi:hypothetical protein [Cobetia sp. L2A1]|uniref:hypothetical protein n=1 Tax=Cobetia sp. L2A1 TaxID=2686360 RepID=UPI00131D244C|nr:hypothetical protein [Cobetia sp. L2A1]
MSHKVSSLAATYTPARTFMYSLSAALLVIGCLTLSPANAADRMDTEAGVSGTATSQHSSQGLPTGSNSSRTANKMNDNNAHYQQDSQPVASQQDKDKAKQQVQKSLTGGKEGSEGGRHATTGQAKPTENWFGCPPTGGKKSARCTDQ